MRFQTIAVCTLTALLAGGLTAQASETPNAEGSASEPALHNTDVSTSTVTLNGTEPIAAPKKIEVQQLAQPAATNSNQEYATNSTASARKTQATVEGQGETLAKTPEAQVFKSDNSLAKVSTPDAQQPASGESLNRNSSLAGKSKEGAVLANAEALQPDKPIIPSAGANTNQVVADAQPTAEATCVAMAQAGDRRCPRPQAVPRVEVPQPIEEFAASPGLSIYIPVGYGADNNTVFLSGTYQNEVRDTAENEGDLGTGGIGIGLGDAQKALGVELSYAFETTDDSFGEGGFNAKLHRRLGRDASVAVGWNGFLNIGRNDFEQSKYGVITKVFRTQESLNRPFSRVAVTAGVGDGQFRSNGAVKVGDNNVNVFGNVAVRVARPVSFIAEWTGQDLGLGLSIAPFKNIPFVITPAVRDVVGGGDGARFVVGAGTAFRF